MNPVNPKALEPLDRELIAALGLDLTNIQVIERMPGGLGGGRLLRLMVTRRTGAATWRSGCDEDALPSDGWLGAVSGDSRIRESRSGSVACSIARWRNDRGGEVGAFGRSTSSTAGARSWMISPCARCETLIIRLLGACHHPSCAAQRLAPHARHWQGAGLSESALGLMLVGDAIPLDSPENVSMRRAAGTRIPFPLADGAEASRFAPPAFASVARDFCPAPIAQAIVALRRRSSR